MSEDGCRVEATQDLDEQIAFDVWSHAACDHERGILLHHRLGNIGLIALFRELLGPHAARLPVITEKVIYNGVHAGEFLALDDVAKLREEVDALSQIRAADPQSERFLRGLADQLHALADCSLRIGKPIVF